MRRLNRTEVAHELRRGFRDVGTFAERFRVGEPVIAFVRFRKPRELVLVRFPVKISAVHDDAADGARMPVHVFRRRVNHDVRAEFKRTAEHRRCKRVVHNQRHAVPVSDFRHFFNVEHRSRGIGNGFGKNRFRVRAKRFLNFLRGSVLIDKRYVDPELFHRHLKQIERAAVNARRADKMVARFAKIENREKRRGLPGRREHRGNAAFKRGNFRGNGIIRRILQTRVKITRRLQIEQIRHLRAGIVFERRALVNRQNARFPFLGLPAFLYAFGFDLHHFEIFGKFLEKFEKLGAQSEPTFSPNKQKNFISRKFFAFPRGKVDELKRLRS